VKSERFYLDHIREAIDDIRAYAADGEPAFRAQRMRQDAIIRKLEVIGEAVKKLSPESRARRPEIPWAQIAGMRDRLTHAYFGVDLGLVWRVIERDLDPLSVAIDALQGEAG
jgi:uncharacterized protein with HEPN domain